LLGERPAVADAAFLALRSHRSCFDGGVESAANAPGDVVGHEAATFRTFFHGSLPALLPRQTPYATASAVATIWLRGLIRRSRRRERSTSPRGRHCWRRRRS